MRVFLGRSGNGDALLEFDDATLIALAQAEVTIACVDRAGVKPRRLPPEMVTRLRSLEQKQGRKAGLHNCIPSKVAWRARLLPV